jgi:type II secretory pathway component PulF
MPYFNYSGYDAEGRAKKGVIEASSSSQAVDRLTEKGIIVADISQRSEQTKARRKAPLSLGGHIIFCRSLAAYLRSGLSLADALKILGRQSNDKRLGSAYSLILEAIEGGKKFHVALAESNAFKENLWRIVESGEQSGSLIQVLEQAAEQYKLEETLQKRIKKAMTYPIVMMIVGLGVVIFLVSYVVPKIATLFTDMGAILPLPTRLLLWISDFVTNWGIWVFGLLLIVWIVMKRKKKRISPPFMKQLRNRLTLSLVMTHLSTLIKSGIPLVQALRMTSTMDVNEARWITAADLVKQGHRFDRALEKLGFPDDVVYIIRVGEMGGDLANSLENVGKSNWELAETQMDRLATLIEPVMTLGLGLSVGFIVVAILLPIFDLGGLVR